MEIFDLFCFGLIERRAFRAKFVSSPLRRPAIMNVVYCTTTLVLHDFLCNKLQTIGIDCFLFYLLSVALLQFLLFFQSPFP